MGICELLSLRRRFYQRFFHDQYSDSEDSEDEISNGIDEIVVHPSQNDENPSLPINDPFEDYKLVENVIDYFESQEIQNLLRKNSKKVSIFKLQISGNLYTLNLSKLDILGKTCANNSMVIILCTRNKESFYLYWKSRKIKHFLMFKIYYESTFMNDIQLFEYMGTFLADTLRREHLGVLNDCSMIRYSKTSKPVELHLMADHRNYNLLLLAAEQGNIYIVDLLLCKLNISTEAHKHSSINAQTLAWNGRHFEVLLTLLKHNLTFPSSLIINDCPNDIKEFYQISHDLNEAMLAKNESQVLEILSQNSEMRHFYNSQNESAVAFALKHKLFDIYGLLISKNIVFGQFEKFDEIKDKMSRKEREKLRDIHFSLSKILPDNHMSVLLLNSRLGHDASNSKIKNDMIQKSFEILNENPFIKVILMIVAASKNFRIIFDFNRDSVEVIDPTADKSIRENDKKSEEEFEEISNYCEKYSRNEDIIQAVYEAYEPDMFHAELVVRVPHLIMKYLANPEQFLNIRTKFRKLFELFEEKLIPEMKKALPRIIARAEKQENEKEKKIKKWKVVSVIVGIISIVLILIGIFVTRSIFYEPTYKFSSLSPEDQDRVRNAPVIYKKVDIVFHNLFPRNATAYEKLSSNHISNMLHKIPLNFDDPHFSYLDELIVLNWRNLTEKLKNKFLNSNFTFQNESVQFSILNETAPLSFNFLASQQIISTLDNKLISVHKMIANTSLFYTERRFFYEHIYEIYYFYMMKRANTTFYTNCMFFNKTDTFNVSFESFYDNFTSFNSTMQESIINEIQNYGPFRLCSLILFRILNSNNEANTSSLISSDSVYKHKLLQLDYEKVLDKANKSNIFILSDVPGSGKTTSFQQFTIRTKKAYQNKWVSYIDVKDAKSYVNKTIQSMHDVRDVLENIFGLNLEDNFERSIFQEQFSSGNLILFWNHFDQVPELSENIAKIVFLIYKQTENIQFLSTRKLYSEALKEIFDVKIYSLVPLIDDFGDIYINDFFIAHGIAPNDISIYAQRTVAIIWTEEFARDFYTPFLLEMITESVLNTNYTNETYINNYAIFEKFIQKRIDIWSDTDFGKKFIKENIINTEFNMMKFYQKFMVNFLINLNLKEDKFYFVHKLKIMRMKVPKELTPDEVSRMGILYIDGPKNYETVHVSFVAFFTAKYVIDFIYNAKDDPTEDEAEMRLRIFFHLTTQIKVINYFIAYYIDSVPEDAYEEFHPTIVHVLKQKFRNIFINSYKTNPTTFLFYIYFFQKDHELLKDLLHVNDEETYYDEVFNFINSIVFVDPFDIYYRNLSQFEIKLVLNERDYQMNTKKRNENIGMLKYSLYLLYNRYENYNPHNILQLYQDNNITLEMNVLKSTNISFVFESIINN